MMEGAKGGGPNLQRMAVLIPIPERYMKLSPMAISPRESPAKVKTTIRNTPKKEIRRRDPDFGTTQKERPVTIKNVIPQPPAKAISLFEPDFTTTPQEFPAKISNRYPPETAIELNLCTAPKESPVIIKYSIRHSPETAIEPNFCATSQESPVIIENSFHHPPETVIEPDVCSISQESPTIKTAILLPIIKLTEAKENYFSEPVIEQYKAKTEIFFKSYQHRKKLRIRKPSDVQYSFEEEHSSPIPLNGPKETTTYEKRMRSATIMTREVYHQYLGVNMDDTGDYEDEEMFFLGTRC